MNGFNNNNFKAGTYVVLLNTCNGEPDCWHGAILVNYCYLLRKDSDTFHFDIEEDLTGSPNGWSNGRFDRDVNKLQLRQATEREEMEYKRLGKPFDITKLKVELSELFPIF